MTTKESINEQRVIPYLAYEDAAAAIEFLCEAFGFEKRFRLPMPDGRIGHAEIAYDNHTVMVASAYKEMGFVSPKHLSGLHAQVFIRVVDVDAHYERANAAGATIATAPTNQYGAWTYRATDLERHRWVFSTSLPEEAGEATRRGGQSPFAPKITRS